MGFAFTGSTTTQGEMTVREVPPRYKDERRTARTQMLEAVAEFDDAVLEKFVEAKEITEERSWPRSARARST
jgi:translation elongation factor EF-G